MIKQVIGRIDLALHLVLRRLGFAVTSQERAQRRLAAVELGAADIAIDCGANVGNFTEVMARDGAMVFAFEPNPAAFEVLQQRFIGIENVHCIPRGVADRPGTMQLYSHINASEDPVKWSVGSSFLAFKENVDQAHSIQVEVVDLVDFLRRLDAPVKLLKLDVEGLEFAILHALIQEGMIGDIEHIFVETHDHSIPELREAAASLRSQVSEHGIENIDFDW